MKDLTISFLIYQAMSGTAKQKLVELLKINPNDYWLNFIKNKEK